MDQMRIMGRVVKMYDYELGLYEKSMPYTLSWKEKLENCKAFGFDYLEMSIDESNERLARLDYTLRQRKELVDAMFETGIRIRSLCLSAHRKYPLGHPDQNVQTQALDILEKTVQLAEDIGIRIIQLAGYDIYYETGNAETKRIFVHNLIKAVALAAKKGIVLGFETMETPFMDTVLKSMEYVQAIHSPYLGIYPDIGNLKNASLIYGKSVTEDIQTGNGHIIAAHLKETKPQHYREITFGCGHTEYTASIKQLKAQGVRLFVGEFWYTGNEDWKEDCAFAATFLRSKLDTVFK